MTGFAGTFAVGLAHGAAETRLPVVGLLAVGCSSWYLIGQLASGDWSVSPV